MLDPGQSRTPDVLDAARRVTLATDPRLAQVLDVGRDLGVAFVVTENLVGRTLSQTLLTCPLPAAEARRLVGETAEALSGAADRGLHHQRLAPDTLVVAADGSVKLTGTAVEAAVAGTPARDGETASRVDALGLVCVLYAALTGRWPGTTPSDLPSAPRVGGLPVPPADLVAGVPADLDALCADVLGPDHHVPAGPAEVAQRLAPWSGSHPLTDPHGLVFVPDAARSPSPAAVPAAAGSRPSATRAATTPATTPATRAQTPAVAPSDAAVAAASAAVSRMARVAAAGATQPEAAPMPGTDDPEAVPRGSFRGWDDLSTIGIPVVDDEQEQLVPFMPAVTPDREPGSHARFVIAVVIGFVLLMVIIATLSLRSLRPPTQLIPNDTTRPAPSGGSTTGAGGQASASTTPPAASLSPTPQVTTATPSASPQIAGIQAIDPQGDGQENNSQATKAVDDDPKTAWKSNYYQTADFAGLKTGLGLVLDLGPESGSDVQQVTVDVAGSGGQVELRTAPGPGLDGSAVVAEAAIDNGHVVLTPAKPVNSSHLVLWFTKLPKTDGKYQLIVSEINIR